MDYQDANLVKFVLKTLKKYVKSKCAIFIKFDPALLLKQYKIGEVENQEINSTLNAIKILTQAGAD